MTVEDEFAKEIAKQLPVKAAYEDAVQPAAREAGQLGLDLMKTLRLALAPIQLAAVLQDRYRRFIESAVARVPAENRVSPPPQIVGPVLEGVRYEPEGTPIDEMFSELLSASMDSARLKDAHPAFPSIIRQLSSDEAKVLKRIFETEPPCRLIQIFTMLSNGLLRTDNDAIEIPTEDLQFPKNIPMYLDHLDRLGLTRLSAERPMEPIRDSNQRQTGGRNFYLIGMTDFGASFMRSCSRE